jgi:hypothetical protein
VVAVAAYDASVETDSRCETRSGELAAVPGKSFSVQSGAGATGAEDQVAGP